MHDREFEWDTAKAQGNQAKHGVSFAATRLVFDDVFALDRSDDGGDHGEVRFVVTGMANGLLLTVAWTERGERTRVISARRATRHERREYYDSQTAE